MSNQPDALLAAMMQFPAEENYDANHVITELAISAAEGYGIENIRKLYE